MAVYTHGPNQGHRITIGGEFGHETVSRVVEVGKNVRVVVAVKAGMRPVDVLAMTFGQHALIGSGGYMPGDVRNVMDIMKSG